MRFHAKRIVVFVGVICGLLRGTAFSQEIAAGASRTNGVAPLSVHFTAGFSSSSSTNRDFHDDAYTWDFDDPSAGNWYTTGKSKNEATGPVTTHIFETPGTYNVELEVSGSTGVIRTESFTIHVDDPDVVYAGNRTVYVNNAGDTHFPGAISESIQISTDDLSSVVAYADRERGATRILFKRGSSWETPALEWPANDGPVTLGAYGNSGPLDPYGFDTTSPAITLIEGPADTEYFINISDKEDWRISDLKIIGVATSAQAVDGVFDMQRVLISRLCMTNLEISISLGHWNTAEQKTIDQIVVSECQAYSSNNNGFYIGCERLALLGNVVQDVTQSHVVRVWQSYMGTISHNIFSGSSLSTSDGRHALKLHGPGLHLTEADDWGTPVPGTGLLEHRTRYTVVSDNIFGTSGPWPVAMGPQGGQSDEQLLDIIFERNRIISDYGTMNNTPVSIALMVWGRHYSIRNNLFDGTGSGNDYTAVLVGTRGVEPSPVGIHIQNNTIFKTGVGDNLEMAGVFLDPTVTNCAVQNNLMVLPDSASSYAVDNSGTDITIQSNLVVDASTFVDATNANPLNRNFRLTDNSPAIDAGVQVAVYDDLTSAARRDASIDVGAYECTSQTDLPVVVNHSCTDITTIPTNWLTAAKSNLHIAYGHTSHGSQLTDGMSSLVAFANGGGRGLSLPTDFFVWNNGGSGGALDLHDYAMADDVGYYPDWVSHTTNYLNNPANTDVNVILWSWCGQVSEKYTNGTLTNEYLAPMNQLEQDYPDVTFVYMTGHVDIGDDANNKAANQVIRDYCQANGKVLYDFADTERYDPDGTYYEFVAETCDYYDTAPGGTIQGNWATEWQSNHTEGVDWYDCNAEHSQPLNANQKAYAAWWLWARLAGWDGQSTDTTPPATPTGLTTNAVTISTVELVWNASTDAESGVASYQIYRNNTQVGTSTSTSYSDSGSPSGSTNSYEVSAINGAGIESARSTALEVITPYDSEAPSVPANLIGTAISAQAINLAWQASTDNAGVAGYRVYRDSALIGSSATTTYADTGLTPETSYSYSVSAYDSQENESAPSDPAVVFTSVSNCTVAIQLAAGTESPTLNMPVDFEVTFSRSIVPASFTTNDIQFTGSGAVRAAEIVAVANTTNSQYLIRINSASSLGTIVPQVSPNAVEVADGGSNYASTYQGDALELGVPDAGGTYQFIVTDDTQLSSYETVPLGSESTLRTLGTYVDDWGDRILLQFPTLPPLGGRVPQSAEVRLYLHSSEMSNHCYHVLLDYPVEWSEETYDTTLANALLIHQSNTVSEAVRVEETEQWYSFGCTDYIINKLSDDGHLSLAFDATPTNPASSFLTWCTKEHDNGLYAPRLVLTFGPSTYETWRQLHALTGTEEEDDDQDGFTNFEEFALRGNPTNAADKGLFEWTRSSNKFELVYAQRTDGMATYTVECTTNLLNNSWTTNGLTITPGTEALDSSYEAITNSLQLEHADNAFIRLQVD